MRLIRQKGSGPVQYKIGHETTIGCTPMNKLLAHDKTKQEQTEFISDQILKFDMTNKKSSLSVGGTKQLHHMVLMYRVFQVPRRRRTRRSYYIAAYLAQRGIKTTHVFSPDTDVLVLVLRRYHELTPEFGVFLGRSMRRFVQVASIYKALGPLKASALPGLHGRPGANVTGSFANKGKVK
jgi:hypothetical protein